MTTTAVHHGKKFENNFAKSVPDDIFYMRLRDTGSFGGRQMSGVTNECDFLVHYRGYLCLFELKTTQAKSLPLSMIRLNQLHGLVKREMQDGIIAGFLVNFRVTEGNETYFIKASEIVTYFSENPTKKSIPLEYFRVNCVQCKSNKKRVNHVYDVIDLIDKLLPKN